MFARFLGIVTVFTEWSTTPEKLPIRLDSVFTELRKRYTQESEDHWH
jgi:hypothetical protein